MWATLYELWCVYNLSNFKNSGHPVLQFISLFIFLVFIEIQQVSDTGLEVETVLKKSSQSLP